NMWNSLTGSVTVSGGPAPTPAPGGGFVQPGGGPPVPPGGGGGGTVVGAGGPPGGPPGGGGSGNPLAGGGGGGPPGGGPPGGPPGGPGTPITWATALLGPGGASSTTIGPDGRFRTQSDDPTLTGERNPLRGRTNIPERVGIYNVPPTTRKFSDFIDMEIVKEPLLRPSFPEGGADMVFKIN